VPKNKAETGSKNLAPSNQKDHADLKKCENHAKKVITINLQAKQQIYSIFDIKLNSLNKNPDPRLNAKIRFYA